MAAWVRVPVHPQCGNASSFFVFFVVVAGPGTLSSAGIARVPGPSPLAAERGRVKGGERDPNIAQKAYFGVGRSPKEGFFLVRAQHAPWGLARPTGARWDAAGGWWGCTGVGAYDFPES